LAQAEEAPVEARPIHGFEEKADGIINPQDRETVAENFRDAGRQKAEREQKFW
jgi:hypothetical protein